MLLYWGIFTIGFFVGSILSFMIFAAKKPEDDTEYETAPLKPFESQSGAIGFDSPYFEQARKREPRAMPVGIYLKRQSIKEIKDIQEINRPVLV